MVNQGDMSSKAKKTGSTEEAQIVELLKIGDPSTVEYWYNNYQPKLTSYVALKVENAADVKEIVQDTFMSCLKHLPLFRGNSSLWTWMVSVTRHEVADYYRKKYAKKALKMLPLSQLLLGTPIGDSHQTSEKVRLVLAQMSHETRELLLKKYVDGMKVADIAQDLDRTAKSVESQLFRARAEFRQLYIVATD